MEGNCYAVTEAAWHILGGRAGEWKIQRIKIPGEKHSHWFLRHKRHPEVILDLSRRQFKYDLPDYSKAVGAAFLTLEPSKKGAEMIERMTWQEK